MAVTHSTRASQESRGHTEKQKAAQREEKKEKGRVNWLAIVRLTSWPVCGGGVVWRMARYGKTALAASQAPHFLS